jgi:hypothetical protein
MSTLCVRRKALAALVVAGAVTLVGTTSAGAHVPPGPGGKGTPAICVPVPGANHTTPAGGPGYGFVAGPPASNQAYEHVSCPPPE